MTRRLGQGERIIRSRSPWQWGMFYLLGMGIQGKVLGRGGPGAIGPLRVSTPTERLPGGGRRIE